MADTWEHPLDPRNPAIHRPPFCLLLEKDGPCPWCAQWLRQGQQHLCEKKRKEMAVVAPSAEQCWVTFDTWGRPRHMAWTEKSVKELSCQGELRPWHILEERGWTCKRMVPHDLLLSMAQAACKQAAKEIREVMP